MRHTLALSIPYKIPLLRLTLYCRRHVVRARTCVINIRTIANRIRLVDFGVMFWRCEPCSIELLNCVMWISYQEVLHCAMLYCAVLL